ncbi:MAG: hypothetical protein NC215_11180, partial [Ruminococcus sp.]|nr:hypothetical protein [Ruminococcus sp.]
GLTDVKILYGRVGTAMESKGLDSAMVWNAERQRYVGSFLVKDAGSYKFTRLSVGSNGITSYTSAPSIQAMPPENVSYYNNSTLDYQFAPNKDAEMVLGIAFSSAASKVEATVINNGKTETVVGVMGVELSDTGKDVVNNWHFKLPVTDGSQEGEWTLRSITLYGVYYNDIPYMGEENGDGVTIDLSAENIQTKVVNDIYVTLSGNSAGFTGYFMDLHSVKGITVSMADYEGEEIQGINVSDVKVKYFLDASGINLDTYGYTANSTALGNGNVDATGTLKAGSKTDYSISDLNFRYAGEYNRCSVMFSIGGASYTAGTTQGTKIIYLDNGKPSDTCPVFDIKWIAPDVKITGTDYAPTKAVTENLGSGTNPTNITEYNYFEDYYALLHFNYGGLLGGYTTPKATLKLTKAGTTVSRTNKASLSYAYSGTATNTWEFTANDGTTTGEVSGKSGSSRDIGDLVNGITVNTIDMTYNGGTFTVKLEHPVTLKVSSKGSPSFRYNVSNEYIELFDLDITNETIIDRSQRGIDVTLPSGTVTNRVSISVGEATVIGYKYEETTQPIKWQTSTTNSCGDVTTTDHTGTIVTTRKIPIVNGQKQEADRTYTITEWSVETTTIAVSPATTTKTYTPGSSVKFSSSADNVATVKVTTTDSNFSEIVSGTIYDEANATTDVKFKEGNKDITEPSDWSNNGNATERTWEE